MVFALKFHENYVRMNMLNKTCGTDVSLVTDWR